MRVYVNSEDIKKAEKSKTLQHNRATTCPIARAVKRYVGGGKVKVTNEVCKFNGNSYPLHESAQRLVCEFDDDQPITPRHVGISDTPVCSELYS